MEREKLPWTSRFPHTGGDGSAYKTLWAMEAAVFPTRVGMGPEGKKTDRARRRFPHTGGDCPPPLPTGYP